MHANENYRTSRFGIDCGLFKVGCTLLGRFVGFDVFHLCLAGCVLGSLLFLLSPIPHLL